MTQQTTNLPENPRWKCPECGSLKVQIGLPAWHYEGRDSLVYVETDAEADIMWWYCEDCQETDSGQPEEVEGWR